jgi:hypothetical protein
MKRQPEMCLVRCAVLFIMAASALTLCACSRSNNVMENQDLSPNHLSQTTIHFNGKDIALTLADARQMQAGLQNYLNSSKARLQENLPANLVEGLPKQVGEAWIDADGNVRMGVWLLEAREELVLTYRVNPTEGQVGYQYVAHLNHGDQKWAVSSITYVKLLPRRHGR